MFEIAGGIVLGFLILGFIGANGENIGKLVFYIVFGPLLLLGKILPSPTPEEKKAKLKEWGISDEKVDPISGVSINN